MKDADIADRIIKDHGTFKTTRQPYEPLWDEIEDVVDPYLADFELNQAGKKMGENVFDGTTQSAQRIWRAGMISHYMSPSSRWFAFRVADEELNKNADVKKYSQVLQDFYFWRLSGSNFYQVTPQFLDLAGSIGTSPLVIRMDPATEKLNFKVEHHRSVYFAEDRFGNIDTIIRDRLKKTVKQALEEFGDKCSDAITKATNMYKKHNFLHAVYPNNRRAFGEDLKITKKRYMEFYVEVVERKLVSKSGLNTLDPVILRMPRPPRWLYGLGIAGRSMVAINRLNTASGELMDLAHLIVRPPVDIPKERMNNYDLDPGGLNFYTAAGQEIKRMDIAGDYPIGVDREDKMEARIENEYSVPMFLALSRAEKQMTAREVIEGKAERSLLMGPDVIQFNRTNDEMFDRMMSLDYDADLLPKPPQILVDAAEGEFVALEVEYIGPLAQAHKRMFKTRDIESGVQALAGIAKVGLETQNARWIRVLDKVDPDKMADQVLDAASFPVDVIRTEDDLEDIREADEEALRQQAALEAAEQAANILPNLQKAPEEGSPADQLQEAAT